MTGNCRIMRKRGSLEKEIPLVHQSRRETRNEMD